MVPPSTIRETTGRIVIPGLVNAHSHAGMAVLRGLGDGLSLREWLNVMMRAEGELTEADIRWSLSLALCEMIRAGTTAFADMFLWTEPLIDTVIAAGLRVAAAPAIFGEDSTAFGSATTMTQSQTLSHIERLDRLYAGEPLVRVMYGTHAIYTCGEATFSEVARRSEATGLGIHVHLSETAQEVSAARSARGETPVQTAARTGLLGPRTLVAHAVKVNARDIELLAGSGCTVVHNPQSNLKLGSGVAPVVTMQDAGVRVVIGTDSPASNDSLDLLKELRLSLSLQRGLREDPGLGSDGADPLAMVSGQAMEALGFYDGPGASDLDTVTLSTEGSHAQPYRSAAAFLQWVATARDVRDVHVAGRALLLDGVLQTLDEERIIFEARRVAARLGI